MEQGKKESERERGVLCLCVGRCLRSLGGQAVFRETASSRETTDHRQRIACAEAGVIGRTAAAQVAHLNITLRGGHSFCLSVHVSPAGRSST